jgi:hypothetical protein
MVVNHVGFIELIFAKNIIFRKYFQSKINKYFNRTDIQVL